MDKIDIMTFMWFIANYDSTDILKMGTTGLADNWEDITIEFENIYAEKRVE